MKNNTMEIYDISSLKRDSKQDNLYDLFTSTFKSLKNENTSIYTVSSEQTMRVDIVSNQVYKSSDYLDFILNVNEIDNPLNIMIGDELKYALIENLPYYRVGETNVQVAKNDLIDIDKQTKIDPNRKKYIEQNYTLIPTVNDSPKDPVMIDGTKIVIGGS
jgi:hypothetical protein